MLKSISPHRLLFLSIFIWIAFYSAIPTTYVNIEPVFFAVLMLVFYIGAFLFGMFVIRGDKELIKKVCTPRDKLITYIAVFFGSLGTLFKFYQRFIQQGYLFAEDYTRLRIELMAGELNSGFLGLITALITPFGLLSFLMILYYKNQYSKKIFFYSFLLALYPIFESYFTQGRMIIIIVVSMMLITVSFYLSHFTDFFDKKISIKLGKFRMLSFPKKLASKKILLPSLILGLIFLSFSVKVVKDRLDLFNYKNIFVVWEEQQQMRLDDDFKEYVINSGEVNVEIAKYSIKHYFSHGVIEYIRMVNHVDAPFGMFYGQYIFNPYVKFFKLLGVNTRSFSELNGAMHKQNVYTTFWGPFYLDFGVFGIPISLLFGAVLKYIYIKARKGYLPFVLFYSYFAFVILGSMFLNLMIGSSIYILNSLLVILLLSKIIPENIKLTLKKSDK